MWRCAVPSKSKTTSWTSHSCSGLGVASWSGQAVQVPRPHCSDHSEAGHGASFCLLEACTPAWIYSSLGGPHGGGERTKAIQVPGAGGAVQEHRLEGELWAHWSGMQRVCWALIVQGLHTAGHKRGCEEKSHQGCHGRSRKGLQMALAEKEWPVGQCYWDTSQSLISSGWVAWDPKHSLTSGTSPKMCPSASQDVS